jgi:hypothetical protein
MVYALHWQRVMRRMPRLAVVRIVLGVSSWVAAFSTPAAAQQSPPGEEPKAEPAPDRVWVHVDAPGGTVLEQAVADDESWRTVCVAPCDLFVPAGSAYRVNGDWIIASEAFTFDRSLGRVNLSVNAAHVLPRVLGSMTLVVGIAVAGVGAFFAVLSGGIWAGEGFAPYSGQGFNLPGFVGVSSAIMAVGAVPLIGGIVLIDRKTTVTEDRADANHTAQGSPWTRDPSWAGVPALKLAPTMAGIPLIGGRF